MATRAEGLHENEDAKYAQKATGKELLKPQEEEQVKRFAHVVEGSNFQPDKHFYPRVLNAQLHPMVQMFMKMGNKRIAQRYCHMHPGISRVKLDEIMNYSPQYFFWAGADLFCVTNEQEQRQMIIIETNSCPSGQKSMPCDDIDENSGYHKIIKHTVLEVLETHCTLNEGALAVVFDKNHMEATGYAAVLADMIANSTLKDEKVYQVEYFVDDKNPPVRWEDGVMHIRDEKNQWIKIRACFRYVTQKPWNRFPLSSKTLVLNSIVSCLAGGRNKLMASKAYELLNMELKAEGLAIRTPETMTDVSLTEIPMYVKSMGMCAVIKNPYSNAGQGVFTVTSKKELDEFMGMKHHYDKFIVQSLVGNSGWSSMTHTGKFYHVGTVPDRKNESYVADIRMMVGGSGHGYMPIAVYARRARVPLAESLENNFSSWSMLGTNLSIKLAEGKWTSDTNRLLLMDNRDFNKLGIGLDDLIDAYVQTVLSCMAIDRMCKKLMVPNKKEDRSKDFNWKLFFSLDHDEALMSELKEINGFGTETEMEQEQTRIH